MSKFIQVNEMRFSDKQENYIRSKYDTLINVDKIIKVTPCGNYSELFTEFSSFVVSDSFSDIIIKLNERT